MGHFLDVAHQVLLETRAPLSARAITQMALAQGLLSSAGKTPWQTMKSKLATDILQRRERSLFMRVAQGKFALREWHANSEYIADRYSKALLAEDVVVFPASSLDKYVASRGFFKGQIQGGRHLMAECTPMSRQEAEEDFSFIQLVSVFVVHFNDLYLTYKRTRRLPESRLHGSYSMIFGGHLNPEDMPPLFNIFDPVDGAAFMLRELAEEICLPSDEKPQISYKGVIYDDSVALSRQHLGIVYDVALRSNRYAIGERGFLMDSRLETLNAIWERRKQFENWSLLILADEIGASGNE